MRRTAHEVAAQALIDGALGFRASLEVTQHERAQELSSQLLPWLDRLGLDAQINDLHREILQSPHGELPGDSQSEAFGRGEAAAFLGWAIQLFERPDFTKWISPGLLLSHLRIFQPTAGELLTNAALRPQKEIDDYCAYCLTVRHQLQLLRIGPDAHTMLKSLHDMRLSELGLSEACQRLEGIESEVSMLATMAPNIKGLYIIRALTAEWLLA